MFRFRLRSPDRYIDRIVSILFRDKQTGDYMPNCCGVITNIWAILASIEGIATSIAGRLITLGLVTKFRGEDPLFATEGGAF